MPFDIDRSHSNWNEMEDPEKAVAEALEFFTNVLLGRIDPLERLAEFEAAMEAATDGPGGNTRLVVEAALKSEIRFYDAERKLPLGAAAQVRLRGRVLAIMAKSFHRDSRSRQSMVTALSLIKWLEEVAGGRYALLDVVGRPTPNAVAEAAVNILGVFVAALRRVERLDARVNADLYKIGHDLVAAYLGPDLIPSVTYSGSDALGGQWFYRWVGEKDVADELVLATYELDKRTRPAEARSEGTAFARDAEHARRFGNLEDAVRNGREFVHRLDYYGMERHLNSVTRYGYFAI